MTMKYSIYRGAWLGEEHEEALQMIAREDERQISDVLRRLILQEAKRRRLLRETQRRLDEQAEVLEPVASTNECPPE
jgi:hypothetical protein